MRGHQLKSCGGAMLRRAALAHAVTLPDLRDALYLIPRGETELQKRMSGMARRAWSKPGFRERQSARYLAAHARPEVKAKLVEASHKRWARPGEKERWRKRLARPDLKTKWSESAQARWRKPGYRERIAAATRAKWQDPVYRAKTLAVLAAARAKKKEVAS